MNQEGMIFYPADILIYLLIRLSRGDIDQAARQSVQSINRQPSSETVQSTEQQYVFLLLKRAGGLSVGQGGQGMTNFSAR